MKMKTVREMAEEAGFFVDNGDVRASPTDAIVTPWLERFAALVRAEVLEEAALKCRAVAQSEESSTGDNSAIQAALSCEDAIRALVKEK